MERVYAYGGLLAVGGVGYYLNQLSVAGERLEVKTKVMVHKVNFKNATLKATVNLINRGDVNLYISNPNVKLFFLSNTGKKPILSTVPKKQDITITAGGSAQFSLFLETADFTNLAQSMGAANFALLRTSGLKLQADTKVWINRFIPITIPEIINVRLI